MAHAGPICAVPCDRLGIKDHIHHLLDVLTNPRCAVADQQNMGKMMFFCQHIGMLYMLYDFNGNGNVGMSTYRDFNVNEFSYIRMLYPMMLWSFMKFEWQCY